MFKYEIIWRDFIITGIVLIILIGTFLFVQKPEISDQVQLKKFSSYEELKNFVKAGSEIGYYGIIGTATEMAVQRAVVKSPATSAERSEDYSTTNIQVQGVDEADIVKTDGKYIYVVSGNKIIILDAYPAENAKILSEIELKGTPNEIFINKDKLVVFGQEPYNYYSKTGIAETVFVPYYSSRTFIKVYDISNKGNPVLTRNVSLDGNYFDSRMIGDYVYVIINQPIYYKEPEPIPLPTISSNNEVKKIPASEIYYFDVPDRSYVFTNIISINVQNDNEELSSKTFLLGRTQNIFVSLKNIYIVYTKRVGEFYFYDRVIDQVIIPIVPWDIKNKINEIRNSNINNYEKLSKIGDVFEEYIGSLNPEQAANLMKTVQARVINLQKEIAKETEKTVIHKISIDGRNIDYKVNGEVPGHVLNQFSMDEYNGYFRIATTTRGLIGTSVPVGTAVLEVQEQTRIQSEAIAEPEGVSIEEEKSKTEAKTIKEPVTVISEPIPPRRPTSQNHVYILDSNLKIVGKLEDLAPGERIYSVRFIGDRGYMVTFRQIDPLFVIDLKEPTNPKVLGYLKIPGVSDYLHPYDENHIIGVGRDATEEGRIKGMKLSLFDITDVANPKEISKYIIGERGTDSEALRDHKAFLFDKQKNLLVIPVRVAEAGKWNVFQGAYVFNLDLDNGFILKGRITHREIIEEEEKYIIDYNAQIRRSLYIDNILYTISQKMIKMNDLDDLNEINKVELQ